ncbi:MAG: hypothetical protein J6L88_06380 [Clostridia bacterium]|nr:hypothetical protein [Clostridia bacterium]
MKKYFALVLALVMLLSLFACGKKEEAAPSPTPESQQENPGGMAVHDDAIAAYDPEQDQHETEETAETEETDAPAFAPVMIVDNAFFRAMADSIEPHGSWGYTLNVTLENKSDHAVHVMLTEASLNDRMCDPAWSYDIEAKGIVSAQICWAEESLERVMLNPDNVTQIMATMEVYWPDNGEAGNIVDETVCIYPKGSGAHQGSFPDVPYQISFFDNNEFVFAVTEFNPNAQMGFALGVYIENRTSETLYFTMDNVFVNGAACDPYWITTVSGHMVALTDIGWYDAALQQAGISSPSDVYEISFDFSVYDGDGNYLVEAHPCCAAP